MYTIYACISMHIDIHISWKPGAQGAFAEDHALQGRSPTIPTYACAPCCQIYDTCAKLIITLKDLTSKFMHGEVKGSPWRHETDKHASGTAVGFLR